MTHEGTVWSESMQQSSAIPKMYRNWVVEDCCMLSLHTVPSCIYSFWHGVIPTSYFILILVDYGLLILKINTVISNITQP